MKLAGQRTEKNLLEADTRFSAHVEQFLMEIARRQPLGDEALAQGLSESSRAAKPDIRLGPPGYRVANTGDIQPAVARADEHM